MDPDAFILCALFLVFELKWWLLLTLAVSGILTPTRFRWVGWSMIAAVILSWVFGNEAYFLGPHIDVPEWMTLGVYLVAMGCGMVLGRVIGCWLRKRKEATR